jgi:hypothetical protein
VPGLRSVSKLVESTTLDRGKDQMEQVAAPVVSLIPQADRDAFGRMLETLVAESRAAGTDGWVLTSTLKEKLKHTTTWSALWPTNSHEAAKALAVHLGYAWGEKPRRRDHFPSLPVRWPKVIIPQVQHQRHRTHAPQYARPPPVSHVASYPSPLCRRMRPQS